jgi:DNA-binding NarL/FixJ family response regulator
LAQLRRAGYTDTQIARRTGLSARTVQRLLAATR